MRWVALGSLPDSAVLAHDILDEKGQIMLHEGVHLNQSLVNRLWKLGIGSVCIQDEATDDLSVRELVSSQTKAEVLGVTYRTLTELVDGNLMRNAQSSQYRKRFFPVLLDVIGQLKRIEGSGEQLGTVYLADGQLFYHSVNVTFLAISLGLGLGLCDEDLVELGIGTLLHDVGKLKIPQAILRKPAKLTADEFNQIKRHTSFGYDILLKVHDLSMRSRIVALQHHERLNGSGYPHGLKGNEIELFARISGVADVYEALTANRVYRKGFLPHRAYEILVEGGGSEFDPRVVEAFSNTISIYPVGMTLVLSTGERAVVVESRKWKNERPVVRVLEDPDGQSVSAPWEIDLAKERTIEIVNCGT